MQFWEKNELPWKVNIFPASSFILIQNMEMKGKNTEKSFPLKVVREDGFDIKI